MKGIETEKEVRPEYSEEDLITLVRLVKEMTTLYDLRKNDWTEENYDSIVEYILRPKQPLLDIYFGGHDLCYMLDIPDTPLNDCLLFARKR